MRGLAHPRFCVCLLYHSLSFSLFVFFLGHFLQILWPVKPVEEQDTVQVIDFMLQNACKPVLGIHLYRLASSILTLHLNFSSAPDVLADVAGNAQAALSAERLTLRLDDLGVKHRHLAVLELRHKDANREANLR